ncbi:MAG: hypothetical protein LBM93_06260 [Oscillospiraceae bacterium]|jgi:hypothetical protein|nr:hypothetical protein [Oscillospiraceae bacterium]
MYVHSLVFGGIYLVLTVVGFCGSMAELPVEKSALMRKKYGLRSFFAYVISVFHAFLAGAAVDFCKPVHWGGFATSLLYVGCYIYCVFVGLILIGIFKSLGKR